MHFISFLLSRFLAYIAVILIGITIVFFIPRIMPSSPVETALARVNSMGAYMDPEQAEAMRNSLKETFGLKGSLGEQYISFIKKVVFTGDFGPSFSMYPTSVNVLISKALPWSFGLLFISMIAAWILGNIIGLFAGYRSNKTFSKILQGIAISIYPIPYYIMALLLIIFFCYIIPIFPMTVSISAKSLNFRFILDAIYSSILPAFSIVLIRYGWWFLSMRALSSNIAEEDYVSFAKLRGVRKGTIMRQYVMRNALLPQITALAVGIGGVFNGAFITEMLFSYPGLGTLAYEAVLNCDYNLIMGTVSLAIVAVATATFIIDLIYPFFDPRIRYK